MVCAQQLAIKHTNEHEILSLIVSGTRDAALTAEEAMAKAA